MARRHHRIPRDRQLDEGSNDFPVTAQPTEQPLREREEEAEEKLVPLSNVGGAAPTALGSDSGGDLPGPSDDLANLAEPEPPGPPEVGAVHVRGDLGPQPPRSRSR